MVSSEILNIFILFIFVCGIILLIILLRIGYNHFNQINNEINEKIKTLNEKTYNYHISYVYKPKNEIRTFILENSPKIKKLSHFNKKIIEKEAQLTYQNKHEEKICKDCLSKIIDIDKELLTVTELNIQLISFNKFKKF